MVGDVFGKHDERHGNIGDGDGADIRADAPRRARSVIGREQFEKSKVGQPLHLGKFGKVDDAHG